jgi:hypothetical protein
MVLMVMVMMMVMVMIPKALSQVGWLRQHHYQSINRLNAFYWPKLPHTQSSIGPKIRLVTLLQPKLGSQARL